MNQPDKSRATRPARYGLLKADNRIKGKAFQYVEDFA
jgi:hypothetical protein